MSSYLALYVKTVLVMFIVFFAAFVLLYHYIYDDYATGVGVGAMSALWGAPGFGAMASAGIWDLRNRNEDESR